MARKAKRRTERRPPRPARGAVPPSGVLAADAGRLDDLSAEQHHDDLLDAPDPIRHATPDVELAEAHLAAGRPAVAEDGEPTDDELAAEALEAGGGRGGRGGRLVRTGGLSGRGGGADGGSGVAAEPGTAVAPRAGNRLVHFVQGSLRELQRVQWPDRRQVMQATGVVIGFVIVAGVFLGVSDLVASKVVTAILK